MKFIMAGLLASIGIATQAQDTKQRSRKAKRLFKCLEISIQVWEQKMTTEASS